jgi:hypothetical protein
VVRRETRRARSLRRLRPLIGSRNLFRLHSVFYVVIGSAVEALMYRDESEERGIFAGIMLIALFVLSIAVVIAIYLS